MRPPSMGKILAMALLVFAFLSLWAKVTWAQVDCWESCFSDQNAGSFKSEYNALYNMVEAARTNRITSGSNGTLVLVDTSNTANINLLTTLSQIALLSSPATTGNNPAYIVAFNGETALYSQSWQNLGRCDAVAILNNFQASLSGPGVQSGTLSNLIGASGNSDSGGQIEQACLLGANAMGMLANGLAPNPDSQVTNPNVLAFVGGPIETYHTACGPETAYGSTGNEDMDAFVQGSIPSSLNGDLANPDATFNAYCGIFENRAAIGTGSADPTVLDEWSHSTSNMVSSSSFVSNSPSFLAAAQQLANCMTAGCCPSVASGRMLIEEDPSDLCITTDEKDNLKFCDGKKSSKRSLKHQRH